MIKIKINCRKNNIKVSKNPKTESLSFIVNLGKLSEFEKFSSKFYCGLIHDDLPFIFGVCHSPAYLTESMCFEFETEEEAFYFLLKTVNGEIIND